MKGFELLETHYWQPLSYFGLTHPFFKINADTVISTWAVLLVFVVICMPIRSLLRNKSSISRFLIINFCENFITLTTQALGRFQTNHFYFVTTFFCFILLCNMASLIPWLDEPTANLSTTLALGTISFLYIQIYAIKREGFFAYLRSYLSPFFLMFPLNVIGKLASIVSISFRLFGNIFGGAIIAKIYISAINGRVVWEIFGLMSGLNITIALFFGLFEGFLQAYVFSMLIITYLSIAIHGEEPIIGDVP